MELRQVRKWETPRGSTRSSRRGTGSTPSPSGTSWGSRLCFSSPGSNSLARGASCAGGPSTSALQPVSPAGSAQVFSPEAFQRLLGSRSSWECRRRWQCSTGAFATVEREERHGGEGGEGTKLRQGQKEGWVGAEIEKGDERKGATTWWDMKPCPLRVSSTRQGIETATGALMEVFPIKSQGQARNCTTSFDCSKPGSSTLLSPSVLLPLALFSHFPHSPALFALDHGVPDVQRHCVLCLLLADRSQRL
eukprot:756506-Hanusia_phi.AAC.7